MIPTTFCWKLFILGMFHGLIVQAAPESSYFNEIVFGRCYAKPVSENNPASCPAIVGTFLSAFSGKLDQNVEEKDFKPYLDVADFSSPPNQALLTIRAETDEHVAFQGFVRPEDTPGGSLVAGLHFCAEDKKKDCPGLVYPAGDDNAVASKEFTGAQSAFWAGAYRQFARGVQGRLLIAILGSNVNNTPLVETVIGELKAGAVSEVTIFLPQGQCTTSTIVAKLTARLKQAGIGKVSCTVDPSVIFPGFSCERNNPSQNNPEESNSSLPNDQANIPQATDSVPKKKSGHLLLFLFVVAFIAFGVHRAVKKAKREYSRVGEDTVLYSD